MKKIFLCSILLLTFIINNGVKADELVFPIKDGVEIKSDSFIKVDDKINFVKGSNLYVSIVGGEKDDFENIEPKLNIEVVDKSNKAVWSTSNPKTKAPDSGSEAFEKYFDTNRIFFNSVSNSNNKISIKIPLDIPGGEYKVKVSSTNYKNINVDYDFVVSNSSYNFTDSEILMENIDVLVNVGYISTLKTDQNNKVIITLSQDGKELFKKEIDKVFYSEGAISLNEKIPVLEKLKGMVSLKIEIQDKDGSVLLTKTKDVELSKVKNTYIYYILLTILIILLLAIFFFLKRRRSRLMGVLMISFAAVVSLTSFGTVNATLTDTEVCGTKPANECNQSTEYYTKSWICHRFLPSGCTVNDVRARKYFSSGQAVNIASPNNGAWVGPISAQINICNDIPGSLGTGDNFYVISDSEGSDWPSKRFYIFKFTKGTSKTVTSNPVDIDKKNINYATYNGNCTVTVSGKYEGPSSNNKKVSVKIVETGKVFADTCRSKTVTSDVFENVGNNDMLDKPVCSGDQALRNTFIAGSKYFPPIKNTSNTGRSPWYNKTVNVCNLIGYASKPADGTTFYTLMEQTDDWSHIRYPIFRFEAGTAKNRIYKDSGNYNKGEDWMKQNLYYYGADKENVPGVSYDGNCTVTFRLDNRGGTTDNWSATYDLIEAGLVSNATCYDPQIIKSSTYKLVGGGLDSGEVEHSTKVDSNATPITRNEPKDGGKYDTIAPFFAAMIRGGKTCKPIGECYANITGNWIPYYTGGTCTVPVTNEVCSCNNDRDYVCKEGVTTKSTSSNDSRCLPQASCTVSSDQSTTTFTIIPGGKIIGNIQYTNNGVVSVAVSSTTNYVYKIPRANTTQSISVSLKDLHDNQIANTSCSINNLSDDCEPGDSDCTPCTGPSCTTSTTTPPTSTTTPTISIDKQPKVSLNKNGTCTISWSIQDMPTGVSCSLTGLNINGAGLNSKSVTLTGGSGSGSATASNLQSNQKYTLSCSGGTPAISMTNSVICRVNPDVKER